MAERAIGTISDHLKSYPDIIYSDQALPNAAAITSAARKFGLGQACNQLQVIATTEIIVAATKLITIELLHSDTEDGTYTTAKTLASLVPATYALGAELVNFVAGDDIKQWVKLKTTTTDDQSADTVDAYLTYISR